MSILDEIVFIPSPLPVLSPLAKEQDHCLNVRFSRPGDNCFLDLPTPWVMCGLTPDIAQPNWNTLCQQLRQSGVPIDCTSAAISNLPVNSIPKRIFRTDIEQPLSLSGAGGATLIELTCRSAWRGAWGWPPEIVELGLLDDWLLSVRSALGDFAPLGLGLPPNTARSTLHRIASLDVDWIAIHTDEKVSLESIVLWLVLFRQILSDAGRPELPIMVRNRNTTPEHLLKLLALGASLVSVDHLLEPRRTATNEQSGIHPRINRPESADGAIIRTVQSLNRQLTHLLVATNSQRPNELVSKLRATSEAAARIARIPLLGD